VATGPLLNCLVAGGAETLTRRRRPNKVELVEIHGRHNRVALNEGKRIIRLRATINSDNLKACRRKPVGGTTGAAKQVQRPAALALPRTRFFSDCHVSIVADGFIHCNP